MRPFSRQNDADGMTNQIIQDGRATNYGSNIQDGGLLYSSSGDPVLANPHHFTPVASADIEALQAQQNQQLQSQNSGYAILDSPSSQANINAGSGAANMQILTSDDSSPPAGDTGTISVATAGGAGSADTCPKSNCWLWLAAGLWIGKRIL